MSGAPLRLGNVAASSSRGGARRGPGQGCAASAGSCSATRARRRGGPLNVTAAFPCGPGGGDAGKGGSPADDSASRWERASCE